jgi:hypothetical protein
MTSRRWWVVAVLVGLCGPGAVACAAGARPAGTEDGQVVGTVLWVRGDAKVKPAKGAAFTPALEAPLYRTDEILAPTRGFVLVELKNGYLARIDEEINLGVSDIALIDAPGTSDSRDTQLKRLLTQAEYTSVGQRVAGARAGKSGAESAATETSKSKSERKESGKERAVEARPAEGASAKSPPPSSKDSEPSPVMVPSASQPMPSGDSTAHAGGKDFGDGNKSIDDVLSGKPKGGESKFVDQPNRRASPKQAPVVRWWLLNGKAEEPQPGEPPAAIAAEFAALGKCIDADPPPSELASRHWRRLLLRVEEGRVTLVRRRAGLPTPECAGALVGKAVPGVTGLRWLVVEVP